MRRKHLEQRPNANVEKAVLDGYVEKLRAMLRCETVYMRGDEAPFKKFRDVVREEFPLLHSQGEFHNLDGALVYRVRGKGDRSILLMSHHDVFECGPGWTRKPFAAEIEDGRIYARGTIDTKTPLFAEMQAVEELLAEGAEFPCDVWIASSNNEEVGGTGIFNALEFFKSRNVRFEFVLDEGGAVMGGVVPFVKERCAVIAVHEKGRHSYTCVAEKESNVKGHASLSLKGDDPVLRMAAFMDETKKTKWSAKLHPEVKATFRACAPYMPQPMRFVFGHVDLFEKLLLKAVPAVSEAAAAMLGTTVAFTRIRGENFHEFAPAERVEATAYFRCVRETDLEQDMVKFRAIADRYGITVEPSLREYCPPADFNGDAYKFVESVLNANYPSCPVVPALLPAGTDARRLPEVSDSILRFAPVNVSAEQLLTMHGDDENIDVSSVGEAVCFYKTLIKMMKEYPGTPGK